MSEPESATTKNTHDHREAIRNQSAFRERLALVQPGGYAPEHLCHQNCTKSHNPPPDHRKKSCSSNGRWPDQMVRQGEQGPNVSRGQGRHTLDPAHASRRPLANSTGYQRGRSGHGGGVVGALAQHANQPPSRPATPWLGAAQSSGPAAGFGSCQPGPAKHSEP